ncbi:hypothetical protein T552_00174 [Pneumocystis carinii B80]|uniref:GATA-type domain-containing protein n=1 Tax=Pneumocystis carinii (strain B80) TaxID=1408658 RepID=A0A0W4ZT44_PNEC8|nr:hypothetical protein T552_00174 [Pneumocystis carinii B80]KTW31532.1 hypothetical protein T552_00174 [Pneumocystis carinii B80]
MREKEEISLLKRVENMEKKEEEVILKILYSFDERHQMVCLARNDTPILVETMLLDEENKGRIGMVSLRTCILTIIGKSPELVLQKGIDFTIYTLEPVEEGEVFSGQGMLSWILNVSLQTRNEGKNVSGRIIESKKGDKEERLVLEVIMRLSKVSSTSDNNLLNTIQNLHFVNVPYNGNITGESETGTLDGCEKDKQVYFEPPIYLYNSLLKPINETQNHEQKRQKEPSIALQSCICPNFENFTDTQTFKSFAQASFLEQLSSPTSESLSPQISSSSSSSPQYLQLPPSSPPIFSYGNQMPYPLSEPSLPLPDFETSYIERTSDFQKPMNYMDLSRLEMNMLPVETKENVEKSTENHTEVFKSSSEESSSTTQELKNNEISDDELPERRKLNEAVRAAQLALEGFSVIRLIDNKMQKNDKTATNLSKVNDENKNNGDKPLKRSGKKISNALRVEMNLLKCIQEGKIPNYCNNCGTIKTVSWRKVKTADDRPEETLCNPCGVWWSSHKSMRPSHLWREETVTLDFHNVSDALYSKKVKKRVSCINKNDENLSIKTKKKHTENRTTLKKRKNSLHQDRVIKSSPLKLTSQEVITREPFSELNNKDNWLCLPKKSISSTIDNNEEGILKSFNVQENKNFGEHSFGKIVDISTDSQNNLSKTTPKKVKNVSSNTSPWKSTIFHPHSDMGIIDAFIETQKDYESSADHYQALDPIFLENDLINTTVYASSFLKVPTNKANSKIASLKDINLKKSNETDTLFPDLLISNKDIQESASDLWFKNPSSPSSDKSKY